METLKNKRKNLGLIQVYTGGGKGKTTAALGLALRALGWGKRVLIIQFLKKQTTGELLFSRFPEFKAHQFRESAMVIEQYGTKDFVDPKNLRPIDFEKARKGWGKAKLEVRSGRWDLVILDEINVAVKFGLIKVEEVLALIKNKPPTLDLVLTGRWADKKIIEAADLVTEFKEIKHPYKKGEKARQGIDY